MNLGNCSGRAQETEAEHPGFVAPTDRMGHAAERWRFGREQGRISVSFAYETASDRQVLIDAIREAARRPDICPARYLRTRLAAGGSSLESLYLSSGPCG